MVMPRELDEVVNHNAELTKALIQEIKKLNAVQGMNSALRSDMVAKYEPSLLGRPEIMPEHMSVEDRNKRLYGTLKSMGLYVTPVPRKDHPGIIDFIIVAAVAPGVRLDYGEGSSTEHYAHFSIDDYVQGSTSSAKGED